MTVRNLTIFLGCLFCVHTSVRAITCADIANGEKGQFEVQIPPLTSQAKKEAIHLFRYILPELFTPAATADEAANASKRLGQLVDQAAKDPFSKIQFETRVGRRAGEKLELHRLIRDEAQKLNPFGYQALWARIGLGDAYTHYVGTEGDKRFLESRKTLVQIYELLYRTVVRQNAYLTWFKIYSSELKEGRHAFTSTISPTVLMQPTNIPWANENGFLLLFDATKSRLPIGQVVWTRDGRQTAIVGVDDVSQKWHWGLPRPETQPAPQRDLTGIATIYQSNGN